MNIAVVGGGVAGLASAGLLSQQGHEVVVYETRSSLSSIGAGVMLWPAARQVLGRLGVQPEGNLPVGRVEWLERRTPQGVTLQAQHLPTLAGSGSERPMAVLRRDLMALLFSACRDVNVRFNEPIDSGRLAELRASYDLVLGCDGRMRSICRSLLLPSSRPRYSGIVNVIGVSNLATSSDDRVIDYWQPNQRLGVVPVGSDKCYWAAAWCEPDAELVPVQPAELVHRFDGWPISDLVNTLDSNGLRTIAVHDLDPLPYWFEGNLILLGDAAHAPLPTSGQGASLALEDAAELCSILSEPRSLSSVLNAYSERRRQRTTAVQAMGRHLAAQLFPESSDYVED